MNTSLYESLVSLLPAAGRAPSAHNTQPWQLIRTDDEQRVDFSWEPQRWLSVTDPNRRDLYLSCGAFAESLLIATTNAGIGCVFEAQITDTRLGWFCKGEQYVSEFTTADLVTRQSHRLRYASNPLDVSVRSQLDSEATACDASVISLPTTGLRKLLQEADAHQLGDRAAARELRQWLRLTRRELGADDGLTAPCMGMSRAQAYGLASVLARPLDVLRRPLGLASLTAHLATPIDLDRTEVLVLTAPRAAFVASPLSYGRLLMRLWLLLHQAGYATHPLSQLIDVPASCDALATQLGIGSDDCMLSIFRVGRPAEPSPRSPRRNLNAR